MDLAQILRELWRLRLAVLVVAALAALAAISVVFDITSSGLKSKSLQFGAASTQLLVDSEDSALGQLQPTGFETLSGHAMVFGNVMTSDPVLAEIAADAGVPREAIVAEGPVPPYVPRAAKEPTAEIRGNDLLGELQIHRLQFDVAPELPLIRVYAQAPDGDSAVRLANAAASGFTSYLDTLQQDAKAGSRVEVRQLGRASGGTVNQGASTVAAVLAFLAVFAVGCLALLMIANVARNWRRAAAVDRAVARKLAKEALEPRLVTDAEPQDERARTRRDVAA